MKADKRALKKWFNLQSLRLPESICPLLILEVFRKPKSQWKDTTVAVPGQQVGIGIYDFVDHIYNDCKFVLMYVTSVELLSQAIRAAHQSLLEPSPDAVLSELQPSWSGGMIASPTVSKVKRRKTTMEAFRGSDDVTGAENPKLMKTYGKKELTDSSGLNAESHEDLDMPEPRKVKKRRAGSGSDEMLGFPDSSLKKKLKRRATTHLESPTYGLSAVATGCVKHFDHSEQKGLQNQISSTVLNTSLGSPKGTERTQPDQSSSVGRMTTPTISTRSLDGTAIPSLDPDEQDPLAAPFTAFSTQDAPLVTASESKATLEVVIDAKNISIGNTTENYDVDLPESQPPSSPRTKSKSKRKLSDSYRLIDFGSDDAAVGLPAEQYQPRPSRSRASHTVDDLVMSIDYSKRPEAVLKKAKRRKTTGFLVDKEEVTGDIFMGFKSNSKIEDEQTAQVVEEHFSILENANSPHAVNHVSDRPTFPEDDEPVPSDVNPPKKKRGRPKKQAVKEDVDTPIPIDTEADLLAHSTTAVAKKSRKGRKTAEDSIPVRDESEEPAAVQELARKEVDGVLEENEDAANVMKELPVHGDLQPFIKESTPAPAKAVAAAAETPQNRAAAIVPKRSPLNSNKVPVRVGLSKRASIQPLLRVVRK